MNPARVTASGAVVLLAAVALPAAGLVGAGLVTAWGTVAVGVVVAMRASPNGWTLIVAVTTVWITGAAVRSAGGVAPGVLEGPLLLVAFTVGTLGRDHIVTLADEHRGALVLAGLASLAAPLVPLMGRTINGASAWVVIGPLQIMPGEPARVLLLLAIAGWLAGVEHRFAEIRVSADAVRTLTPLVAVLGPSAAILTLANDLGPLLLLGITVLLAVWWTARRWVVVAIGLAAAVLGGACGLLLSSNAAGRVMRWVTGDEPHAVAAALTQHAGGLTGRGVDAGAPLLYAWESDLILASIGGTFGAIGSIAVIVAMVAIVRTGIAAAACSGGTARLVTIVAATSLGVQASWLTASTLGFVPLVGVTFPFASQGRSSLVMVGLLAGLIYGAIKDRFAPPAAAPSPWRSVGTSAAAVSVAAVSVFGIGAFDVSQANTEIRDDFNQRATILDVHGEVMAAPESGRRSWSDAESLAVVAGAGGPLRADIGLEANSEVQESGCPIRPLERIGCRENELVSTIDLAVQKSVAEVALSTTADIVVLRGDGGLVAAADARGAPTPGALSWEDGSPWAPTSLTRLSPPGAIGMLLPATALLERGGTEVEMEARELYTARTGLTIANPPRCTGSLTQLWVAVCRATFAAASDDLGPKALQDAAEELGFDGNPAGGLGWDAEPARLPGSPPAPDLAEAGIGGGGMALTPLHAALMAATIASGVRPVPTSLGQPPGGQELPDEVASGLVALTSACVTQASAACQAMVVPEGWEAGAAVGTAARLAGGSDGWAAVWLRSGDQIRAIAVRAVSPSGVESRSGPVDAVSIVNEISPVVTSHRGTEPAY